MNVASAILSQLGGKKFLVMTGAQPMKRENGLICILPNGMAKDGESGKAVNRIQVTLDTELDLYNVETFWVRGINCVERGSSREIQVANLKPEFERLTGLRLTL